MKSLSLLLLALVAFAAGLPAVVIPESAEVLESGNAPAGIEKHYIVPENVSISVNSGIRNVYYVRSGGSITKLSGIENIVYAETGATISSSLGSKNKVYVNVMLDLDLTTGWFFIREDGWAYDPHNEKWLWMLPAFISYDNKWGKFPLELKP